nr:hypothetical protein [Tanacetum cinerariifolium]
GAALTADGLAALTLGGEILGLGEGCQMKGLLRVLLKPFKGECVPSGIGGATDIEGGDIKPECLGDLTSSGD